ncbi:MAG: hypothetical protein NTX04_08150, partial [Verrucomicrobia bacterium]|nr:hypothetical protein [Verrucomicrobiota bacterium]
LNVPLRDAGVGHESADLALFGRLLSRIHSGEAQQARKVYEILSGDGPVAGQRELIHEIHDTTTRLALLTNLALLTCQYNVAGEQIDSIVELGLFLRDDLDRIGQIMLTCSTPEDWSRMVTRLRTVLNLTKNFESVMLAIKAGGGVRAVIGDKVNGDFFARDREKFEESLADLPKENVGLYLKGIREGITGQILAIANDSGMSERAALAGAALALAPRSYDRQVPMPELIAGAQRNLIDKLEPATEAIQRMIEEQAGLRTLNKLPEATRESLVMARWAAVADLFKAQADFEEVRAVADNGFVGDLRRVTVALQSMQMMEKGNGAEKTAGLLGELDQAFRLLEAGHNLQELIDGVTALIAVERWDVRSPQARTSASRDWAWISTRILTAPIQLNRLRLKNAESQKAVEDLTSFMGVIPESPIFLDIRKELELRRDLARNPASLRGEMEQMLVKLKSGMMFLQKPLELARKNLAKLTPKISALALALAKEEGELKKDSEGLSAKAGEMKPEENKSGATPQLGRQQSINLRIESLKDLIRADANELNILKKDQRERMRDADDILATLKEPPPAAEEALRLVTEHELASVQKSDLEGAVVQEQRVVDALMLVARHFEAVEEGKDVAKTREELRNLEGDLGIKDALEDREAKAADLAAMSEKTAEEQLKDLEQKLAEAENNKMRDELKNISDNALNTAKDMLDRAKVKQTDVLNKVTDVANKEKDPRAKLSALEAARVAAAMAREAETAAKEAKAVADQLTIVPMKESTKLAAERATLAIPLADLIVAAAERMGLAKGLVEVQKEAAAVSEKANGFIGPEDQARNYGHQTTDLVRPEATKAGQTETKFQEAMSKGTLTEQKAALAIEAARQADAAARLFAEQAIALAKIPEKAPDNRNLAMA